MASSETRFGVWLQDSRVGTLNHRDDYTWLTLEDDYVGNPDRHVLGLVFEDNLAARHAGTLTLPNWFSNLLPEGRLRDLVAVDRGVSAQKEMELLAHVGHDLPGAVRVLLEDEAPETIDLDRLVATGGAFEEPQPWRFSLAGVGIKFSMIRRSDKLRLPAKGYGGDWIVKLPDPLYRNVPHNEHAMMRLASLAGIDTPEHILVARNDLEALPDHVWPSNEVTAYAVKRFDRGPGESLVHMEDLAQVRNFHASNKYVGTFESLAAYVYRGVDERSLRELVRRLTFNALISNGDAHLKNWSLLYEDPRRPRLSPAYDLVSTGVYAMQAGHPEKMALKLAGSRKFELMRVSQFRSLGAKLGADGAALQSVALETIDRVQAAWPEVQGILESAPDVRAAVEQSIRARSTTLTRRLE
jgi:serine/threonine-protein kinase HipA